MTRQATAELNTTPENVFAMVKVMRTVVEQETRDAMRRLMESLADVPDYEAPAKLSTRLADELSGRGLWPPVMGAAGDGRAWFRVAGFGLSVHTPSSVTARRMAERYGIGFRTVGSWRWRVLAPDLTHLDRAVAFVLRGEL